MNGLDSPLEALAFIPLNLGPLLSATVNNLWAWLAVITTAFSFWRLCSSSVKTTSSHIILSPPPTPIEPTPTTSFIEEKRENVEEENEEERVLTRGNSKKYFTVYEEERENDQEDIDNHDHHDGDEMDGGDEVDEKNEWVMIKRWGSSSELTVKMRGGDLGWYSYQNRKVIDGSVVRLWGEERENGGCSSTRVVQVDTPLEKILVYPLCKLFISNSF